jgi:Mn-dependent DtxR family transcriptional regulator
LVSHETYENVSLTALGAKKAADMNDRHMLLTPFLV